MSEILKEIDGEISTDVEINIGDDVIRPKVSTSGVGRPGQVLKYCIRVGEVEARKESKSSPPTFDVEYLWQIEARSSNFFTPTIEPYTVDKTEEDIPRDELALLPTRVEEGLRMVEEMRHNLENVESLAGGVCKEFLEKAMRVTFPDE